mmetsp:Transcript_32969/g.52824  ORF Transcript_32969/g.52824 Transcript_32969/m.52824 type:complete len:200 (+) Transcript_32969:262-861(+)
MQRMRTLGRRRGAAYWDFRSLVALPASSSSLVSSWSHPPPPPPPRASAIPSSWSSPPPTTPSAPPSSPLPSPSPASPRWLLYHPRSASAAPGLHPRSPESLCPRCCGRRFALFSKSSSRRVFYVYSGAARRPTPQYPRARTRCSRHAPMPKGHRCRGREGWGGSEGCVGGEARLTGKRQQQRRQEITPQGLGSGLRFKV